MGFLKECGHPVILKTCSFEPTETKVRISRIEDRIAYEIDGRPAVKRYAEIVGVKPEELGPEVFTANPLGLMIEGKPWVRSPVLCGPDDGIVFASRIVEGAELHLLRSTDLVGDTRRALAEATQGLGREPSIGILFNCAHRAVEMRVKELEPQFQAALGSFPVVGFHSYGENYLAQLNQTLVGLILG